MAVSRGYDGLFAIVSFDGVVLTATTEFSMPKSVGSIRVHVPALDGAATTLKLQAYNHYVDAFQDIFLYDPGDGTSTTQVSALPEGQTTVIPASVLGMGVFRFVPSADQTTAVKFPVYFDRL